MSIKANTPVKYITVHCSATKATSRVTAKDIDRWHKEQGYNGIGYHYVIRRSGMVEKGRPENVVGAHVMYHNTGNIGVCLVGGIDAKGNPEPNYTEEQFAALGELLIDLHARYPDAEILGHRDFPRVRKACPCFDVRTWLEETGVLLGN